jgi:hypothetical protein
MEVTLSMSTLPFLCVAQNNNPYGGLVCSIHDGSFISTERDSIVIMGR